MNKGNRNVKKKEHKISRILPGSIAKELEIEPGDILLSVNNTEIGDVFDYHYQLNEEYLTVVVRKPDGEEWEYEIEKEYEEDLGIEFENGLMDDYRSCSNRCIFCFIDQMPPGMRDTLYFKDDDSRLSFLQGNYVTLTNMKDKDIERIITYKLAPINISVQTMNPQLRCKMLNNRFAGEALKKMRRLYEAGIEMNGQIVLCKGVNDEEELERSIRGLTEYIPHMKSVSVVPAGLTKYRDGLYPLELFTRQEAKEVLQTIHRWQEVCMERWGTHFVHASDEWYLLAEESLPPAESYDGYVQLENGVGMLRLLLDEFRDALQRDVLHPDVLQRDALHPDVLQKDTLHSDVLQKDTLHFDILQEDTLHSAILQEDILHSAILQEDILHSAILQKDTLQQNALKVSNTCEKEQISIATGMLAAPFLEMLAKEFMQRHPHKKIQVFAIRNDFFGEQITVAGLLTGQDIYSQLKDRELGERLLLPCSLLRSGEEIFLDDMTVAELKNALQVHIDIVNSNGQDLYDALRRSGS